MVSEGITLNVSPDEYLAIGRAARKWERSCDPNGRSTSGDPLSCISSGGVLPITEFTNDDDRYLSAMVDVIGSGAVEMIRSSGKPARVVVRRDDGWPRIEATT